MRKNFPPPLDNVFGQIYVYIMKQPNGENLRKVSMNIPKNLWSKLKVEAAKEDITVTEIILRLCRKHLSRGKKKQRGS